MQGRVHMLLPSLLLHHAAGLPNGSTFLQTCINTAYSGKGALQVWEIFQRQQEDEDEEQEGHAAKRARTASE